MTSNAAVSPDFVAALNSLRELKPHSNVTVSEIPAPRNMAPFAAALSAETTHTDLAGRPLGTGRLVILHDPRGQDGWNGEFRIISLVSADIDHDLGADPLAGEVAWSWLRESLDSNHAEHHDLVGSVTRELSDSFGGINLTSYAAAIDVRASWTPQGTDMIPHCTAWIHMILQAAGLDPQEGVVSLSSRRYAQG
ncbi:MAG: DUF3000 domain-containing protein [Actinomycetaceae bacterium]|nr:DUF3000 domain-containing protein [Actinomycetaceae bacterium]